MTKINHVNHTIEKDINFIFFRKFVTVFVQKLNGIIDLYLDPQFSQTK